MVQANKNSIGYSVLAILLSFFLWCSSAFSQELIPVPKFDYVTDTAGLFTPQQRNALENKLADFEKKVGSQVCVVVVPTTNGEPIEDFAHRIGAEWKPGRKGVGDGLLFVVALNDHRVRIDVMRALEGAIPDVTANRILQEAVLPNFKADNYYQGINQGLDLIFKQIQGEGLPPPEAKTERTGLEMNGEPLWDEPWVAIIFIGFVMTMMLRQLLGKKSAPLAGVLVGALGAFIMQSIIAGVIIGALVMFASLLVPTEVLEAGARRTARMNNRRNRRFGSDSGFGGFGGFGAGFGGGFGGGGFGGSSDSGPSSGGGGDAAGGGASGGW